MAETRIKVDAEAEISTTELAAILGRCGAIPLSPTKKRERSLLYG